MRAATYVQELFGIESLEVTAEEDIIVLYHPDKTTPETIASAFRLQGFLVEIKP